MKPLEYSKLYSYQAAAEAIGVSLAWVERYIGGAIKAGMVLNAGTEQKPRVSGADLKRVCMKRWSELESEIRWRAFDRVRAREQGLPLEEGAA